MVALDAVPSSPGKRVAFITGVTGQDGSYLAELLVSKGYIVHGLLRRSSSFNTWRIEHLRRDIKVHYGDLTDNAGLMRLMTQLRETFAENCDRFEVYHLAAQSHVAVSFEIPLYTGQTTALGTLNLLEALKQSGWFKHPGFRLYNAATSELFGKVAEVPQSETTPFYPRSPYAAAKLYSLWMCRNYREAHGAFITNGILFNHTSPRRGENFILRKITLGVAKIVKGIEQELVLGNLDAERDMGHAADYVYGMWLMMQHGTPDDFVLATGYKLTVREMCTRAFREVGIELEWKVKNQSRKDEPGNEYAVHSADPTRVLVRTDAKYFRPTEVDLLLGDASKARRVLGWKPKRGIDAIIKEMIARDLVSVAQLPDREWR